MEAQKKLRDWLILTEWRDGWMDGRVDRWVCAWMSDGDSVPSLNKFGVLGAPGGGSGFHDSPCNNFVPLDDRVIK